MSRFVADKYGDAKVTDEPTVAGQWAGALKAGDRKEFRARVLAALDQLKKNPNVDPTRTAAIGYCFGGTGVLELARSAAAVKCRLSFPFHGDLGTDQPAEPGMVKCQGAWSATAAR